MSHLLSNYIGYYTSYNIDTLHVGRTIGGPKDGNIVTNNNTHYYVDNFYYELYIVEHDTTGLTYKFWIPQDLGPPYGSLTKLEYIRQGLIRHLKNGKNFKG